MIENIKKSKKIASKNKWVLFKKFFCVILRSVVPAIAIYLSFFIFPSYIEKNFKINLRTIELIEPSSIASCSTDNSEQTTTSTEESNMVVPQRVINIIEFENKVDLLLKQADDLNVLMKLPFDLFGFNLFVKNSSVAYLKDTGQELNIRFDMELINDDGASVKKGESVKITTVSKWNPLNLQGTEISLHYFLNNEELSGSKEIKFPIEGSYIKIYLKPNFFASTIMFIIILAIFQGLVSLSSRQYSFILKGKPFIDKK